MINSGLLTARGEGGGAFFSPEKFKLASFLRRCSFSCSGGGHVTSCTAWKGACKRSRRSRNFLSAWLWISEGKRLQLIF